MSQSRDESSFKTKLYISPTSYRNFYFPAGSISSIMDSMLEPEQNASIRSDKNQITIISNNDNLTESYHPTSYQIISYEQIFSSNNKETQTECFELDESKSKKIEYLTKNIEDLKHECIAYAKQNEDLREEIYASGREIENDTIKSLKEEVKRLKNKLSVHENMIEKVISIAEDLCGEHSNSSRNFMKIDFHAYNYLISKLEIVRSRMKRHYNKIHSLESDKASITDLLNFYISAAKLIEGQNHGKGRIASVTPECSNPIFSSRKSSILMEQSINTIRPQRDENEIKKPSNSNSDPFDNKDLLSYPNTLTSLKGISRLSKPSTAKKTKIKSRNSYSVSPLLPKPKKNQPKAIGSKENNKSTTLRASKPSVEELKKKQRNRCKS